MEPELVRNYFDADAVVDDYAKAATEIGLWISEEKVLTRVFAPDDSILELGCGAGRIAIGLHELGYRNVLATDYSRPMVKRARQLATTLEYRIPMRVCDATQMEFEEAAFDGVIFGFNGLMQIPQSRYRKRALCEILRVLRPGGWFVFTSHDRERSHHQQFWHEEQIRWAREEQNTELDDFGDRTEVTQHGAHYMHVPSVTEMESLLTEVGFQIKATAMRSELTQEPAEVEKFSDDCRFWVVRKAE